jgi:enoyl-CoA hydratase/carnithine racemase
MSDLETIRLEHDGPVAVITLNRPERLNAYTAQMGVELFGSLHRLDGDDSVRAIVITGAGRAFCAGADLAAGGSTFAGERPWERAAALEAKVRPWNMSTPVIVAINGPAVGVGATLPLQWDLRIASESARIGFVFTRRGIMPEANSTWLLPRLIGTAKALDLLITGRILSAREALDYGIVSRVVPPEELVAEAIRIGRDIATNTAPASVAVTKRLVWRQIFETDPVRAKAAEDLLFHWIGKQPDAAEGVTSFLEKREPRWSMSKSRDLPDEIAELL